MKNLGEIDMPYEKVIPIEKYVVTCSNLICIILKTSSFSLSIDCFIRAYQSVHTIHLSALLDYFNKP